MNIPLKYVKNSCKYIGNITYLTAKGHPGDICSYDGNQYVYTDKTWEPVGIRSTNKTEAMICSQCGAPLFGNICEYCGTRYR